MDEKTQELLNAIGALVEQLAFFRDRLEENGFDEDETLVLCRELMRVILGVGHGEN